MTTGSENISPVNEPPPAGVLSDTSSRLPSCKTVVTTSPCPEPVIKAGPPIAVPLGSNRCAAMDVLPAS